MKNCMNRTNIKLLLVTVLLTLQHLIWPPPAYSAQKKRSRQNNTQKKAPQIDFSDFIQPTVPFTTVELVKQVKPAVVLIKTYNDKGAEVGTGTGFYVSPDLVVTNYHVIKRARQIVITSFDETESPIDEVVAENPKYDLAVLRTSNSVSPTEYLLVSHDSPEEGSHIYVIGNPLGLYGTVSDGLVSAIRYSEESGKILQITAPVSPGSSGSPVVNEDGIVVGVVSSIVTAGQNINIAISSQQLSFMLDRVRR